MLMEELVYRIWYFQLFTFTQFPAIMPKNLYNREHCIKKGICFKVKQADFIHKNIIKGEVEL